MLWYCSIMANSFPWWWYLSTKSTKIFSAPAFADLLGEMIHSNYNVLISSVTNFQMKIQWCSVRLVWSFLFQAANDHLIIHISLHMCYWSRWVSVLLKDDTVDFMRLCSTSRASRILHLLEVTIHQSQYSKMVVNEINYQYNSPLLVEFNS